MRLLYALLLLDVRGELSSSLAHPVLTHIYHPHPCIPTASLASASPSAKGSARRASRAASVPSPQLRSPSAVSGAGYVPASAAMSPPSPLTSMGAALSQSSEVLWPTDIAALIRNSLAGLQVECGCGVSGPGDGDADRDREGTTDAELREATPSGIPAAASVTRRLC